MRPSSPRRGHSVRWQARGHLVGGGSVASIDVMVSAKPTTAVDANMPVGLGFEPARQAEWRELLTAVRAAVEEELTPRQRRIFVAIAVAGVPLDALAAELGSSRGAIYKTMFDARRKLRAALVANGYLDHHTEGRP